jgi:hypothetical protein
MASPRSSRRGGQRSLYLRFWDWADIWLRPSRWRRHARRFREWWLFGTYRPKGFIDSGPPEPAPKGKVVPLTDKEQARLTNITRVLEAQKRLKKVTGTTWLAQMETVSHILRDHGYGPRYSGRVAYQAGDKTILFAYKAYHSPFRRILIDPVVTTVRKLRWRFRSSRT